MSTVNDSIDEFVKLQDDMRRQQHAVEAVVGTLVEEINEVQFQYERLKQIVGILKNSLVRVWEMENEHDDATETGQFAYTVLKDIQNMLDAENVEQIPPVGGDMLPQIGETVKIHLSSIDGWVDHTVVGYYVWPDLDGNKNVHRVFVRVADASGYLNARCLKDIRRYQYD